MTAKELQEKINDTEFEHESGYNDPLDALYDEEKNVVVGDLNLKYVDSGGAEGDGAEKWVVFKVGKQLFRMTGYYSSWGDDDWDGDLEEVKPKQVMRTEYEGV